MLPWLRSGRRDYDAFELTRAARDLGVADGPWERALVLSVFALPALAGGAWLAWSLRRPGAVSVLSGTGGLVLLAAATVALATDLPSRPGPYAALVVGSLMVLLVALRSRRWRRRPRTTNVTKGAR